jgi:hypothetical protein
MRREVVVGDWVGFGAAEYRFVHHVTEVGENYCRLASMPQVRYSLPHYVALPSFGGLVTTLAQTPSNRCGV